MLYIYVVKIVIVGFFMPPEILRVGFFMGWPKKVGFLMVVFFMVGFFMIPHLKQRPKLISINKDYLISRLLLSINS